LTLGRGWAYNPGAGRGVMVRPTARAWCVKPGAGHIE